MVIGPTLFLIFLNTAFVQLFDRLVLFTSFESNWLDLKLILFSLYRLWYKLRTQYKGLFMKKFIFTFSILSSLTGSITLAQVFQIKAEHSTTAPDASGSPDRICGIASYVLNEKIDSRSLDMSETICSGGSIKQIGVTEKKTTIQKVTSNVLTCSIEGNATFECLNNTTHTFSKEVFCKNGSLNSEQPITCDFDCAGSLTHIKILPDVYNSTHGYTSVKGSAICTVD